MTNLVYTVYDNIDGLPVNIGEMTAPTFEAAMRLVVESGLDPANTILVKQEREADNLKVIFQGGGFTAKAITTEVFNVLGLDVDAEITQPDTENKQFEITVTKPCGFTTAEALGIIEIAKRWNVSAYVENI